jgi:hypothetical protein
MRAVQRHVEPEPRAVERGRPFRIGGRDHHMVQRGDRCRGGPDRERAFLRQFKEKQPDTAGGVGRSPGPLPRQGRARYRITAFGFRDRLRLQRQPIQPAMHFFDVAGAKTEARQSLALRGDDAADPVRGRALAARRHQLQRHVVEREQHAVGAVAAVAPRQCAREQGLVGSRSGFDIADENDDVIEPGDHGNSPRVFFAARTFSTPIAIAAVRWEIPSALARATIWSKARSRM